MRLAALPEAQALAAACVAKLEADCAKFPGPPADWRMQADLNCTCEDCLTMQTFLHSTQEAQRFALRNGDNPQPQLWHMERQDSDPVHDHDEVCRCEA